MTYRTSQLWIKRPIMNRLAWWFYDKFCGEPFIPEGKIIVTHKKGNPQCVGHDGRIECVQINFIPKKFVPGVHELYTWEEFGDEIKSL